MSRISNFIVLSFAMLSDKEKVMSWKGTIHLFTSMTYSIWIPFETDTTCRHLSFSILGNHTIGIVSGGEDYNTLKVSFKELFNEINEMIEQAEIEVDGHKIPLEFYLSGDYKVY